MCFFFFKQKTAYEMRISDWSSDVCSSDLLDAAGAELALDIAIGDDRNLARAQRQLQHLAEQMREALVLGMHRHRDVAEHRLRAGGGDGEAGLAIRAAQRIIGEQI